MELLKKSEIFVFVEKSGEKREMFVSQMEKWFEFLLLAPEQTLTRYIPVLGILQQGLSQT